MNSPVYDYSFELGADGCLWGRRVRSTSGTDIDPFPLSLASRLRAALMRGLSPQADDLLDLAAAVASVDRLSPRRPNADGDGWSRHLSVVLPVREPGFWSQPGVTEQLCQLLGSLTDDHWSFQWRQRPDAAQTGSGASQALLVDAHSPVAGIVLFSGGLDSFAGVCDLLTKHPQSRYGLLAVATSDRVAGVQRAVYGALKSWFQARVWRIEVEPSLPPPMLRPALYRTRSFLFQSVGAATAHACGLNHFYQCENGIASLCLPSSPWAPPWHTAQGVHPRALREMSTFFSRVFGTGFRIENPYLLHTKAEMCRIVKETGLGWAVGDTVSCDRFPQRVAGRAACGKCGPCVLRLVALHASGLSSMVQGPSYRYDITRRGAAVPRQAQPGIYAIQGQQERLAATLHSAEPWRALTRTYPRLEVSKLEIARILGAPEAAVEQAICDMLVRFAEEWRRFPLCREFRDVVVSGDRRRLKPVRAPIPSLPLWEEPHARDD